MNVVMKRFLNSFLIIEHILLMRRREIFKKTMLFIFHAKLKPGVQTYFSINDGHRKNCDLLNLAQELTEMEAWLLLTFFSCLHNQLISMHSTTTY